MHIVQICRNGKQALKQENYVNLMKKIASLSSIMHEEEKMSTPNYEYEEFTCDKCTQVKTGLNEILIYVNNNEQRIKMTPLKNGNIILSMTREDEYKNKLIEFLDGDVY